MFTIVLVSGLVIGYWVMLQFMFWKLWVQNRKDGMSPVGFGREQQMLGVMWVATLLLMVCMALVVFA